MPSIRASCSIDSGGGVSSPLHAKLFASSTNISDFAVVAFSAPICKFDTGGALGGSQYGVRTMLHPTVYIHCITMACAISCP